MAMSRRQTILVVDDQDVILDFMSELLVDAGYAVETASSAVKALERIQQARPGLVITDFSMPGMDGWQLVQAIRALPFGQDLPVVVMSAGSRLPFRSADLDPRMAFLAKPFGIEALMQLVQSLLDASATQP